MAAGPKVPLHRRKSFQVAVGLLVTLGCLGLAFRMIVREEENWQDALREIGLAFQQAHWWTLPLIWALLFVFYWLKALRWRLLLTPLGDYHPMRDLFPPILVGFAFNNVLPARLGEFVRVYVFSREQSAPKSAVLASVALERIVDAGAILAYLIVGLLFVPGLDPSVRVTAWWLAGLAAGGGFVVVLYLSLTRPFVRFVERCLKLIPFIPASLRSKVAGILEVAAGGLAAIRDWRLLVSILLNSLVQWGINGLIIWISLLSFDIHISPLAAAILMGMVALGVAVPSTPGFFGVIQLVFVLVLKAFTDETVRVGAASIYFHMSQYIPVTLLGLYYFSRSGLKVADVRDEAEHEEEELEALGEAAVAEPSTNGNPGDAGERHPRWPTVFTSCRPAMQHRAGTELSRSGETRCCTAGDSFPASWSR